jgi:hypothetical protein
MPAGSIWAPVSAVAMTQLMTQLTADLGGKSEP